MTLILAIDDEPSALAARLLDGDYRNLRCKAALSVLDLLLRAYQDALIRGTCTDWSRAVPRLRLPRGKALAEALGMPSKGSAGKDADAALWAWSAVELRSPPGTLRRLVHRPEGVSCAPGRTGAWLVTPGELLHPTRLLAEMGELGRRDGLAFADRPWRRLLPWPDELAPDDWTSNSNQRGDAAFVGLGLVLTWTEGAGREHGARWLEAPGVALNDPGWAELVDRASAEGLNAQRSRALDSWQEAGWVAVEGDLVSPGPQLPRLTRVLNEAAEGAKKKKAPKRRQRKPKV